MAFDDFIERINQLPRAELPHMMSESQYKGCYNFSTACTDYLQNYYIQILNIRRSWNFLNPSLWFLESIKDFIEFVPDLLEVLQPRSILPFIDSFRYTGTYYGFQQLCVGMFGAGVEVEYVDPYTINISGISSSINYKLLGEGDQDFFLTTEDLSSYLITEDEFVPPEGLWVIEDILRKNLPAGVSEIAIINFI